MEIQRIRARINEIASSSKNVRFEELQTLLDNHISGVFPNYSHRDRGSHNAFTVGDQTFNIPKPAHGCVKGIYVRKFLEAMLAVGLYNPEEEP